MLGDNTSFFFSISLFFVSFFVILRYYLFLQKLFYYYYYIIIIFFMKIIFIFSCSGMFRDVPECSGMFWNVSCSWFYRRPKNSYHKALSVPSRRVNYYKHVKFDLRDNITSRDVNKKVRIWREPAARTRFSNSRQNPVLKTSRNGYLDLRRTRKKKIIVLANEFDQAFRFCTKPHRK